MNSKLFFGLFAVSNTINSPVLAFTHYSKPLRPVNSMPQDCERTGYTATSAGILKRVHRDGGSPRYRLYTIMPQSVSDALDYASLNAESRFGLSSR